MPVTYAPVPLLATVGAALTQSLYLVEQVEGGAFEPVDCNDYSGFELSCGGVTLAIEDDEGLPGLSVVDGAGGEIEIRFSAAQIGSFTLKDGLAYTAFPWRLTAVYSGDSEASEIGSGELRIRV